MQNQLNVLHIIIFSNGNDLTNLQLHGNQTLLLKPLFKSSKQGWTATTRNGVTRKGRRQRWYSLLE